MGLGLLRTNFLLLKKNSIIRLSPGVPLLFFTFSIRAFVVYSFLQHLKNMILIIFKKLLHQYK